MPAGLRAAISLAFAVDVLQFRGEEPCFVLICSLKCCCSGQGEASAILPGGSTRVFLSSPYSACIFPAVKGLTMALSTT